MTSQPFPNLGKHGFSGSYSRSDRIVKYDTFSVGVFEWLMKSSGKGVKKSKVKVRVKGDTNNHNQVFYAAIEIARMLDLGTYNGPKTVHAAKFLEMHNLA